MPKRRQTPPVKCRIPECPCYGKAHKGIHAHGHQPNGETRYFCAETRRAFNSRTGTPYARMKKPKTKLVEAMKLLTRGSKKAAVADALEVSVRTLDRWVHKAAEQCRRLSTFYLHGLQCRVLQFDEIKTYCRMKSSELWLWQAIDPASKLWLEARLTEQRDGSSASRVVWKVRRMLLEPERVALVSIDGLVQYETPVLSCFANAVYVQIIKRWDADGPKEIERRVVTGQTLEYAEGLFKAYGVGNGANTAFTERLNGTIRAWMSPLTRRTYGYAKSTMYLQDLLCIVQAAYNFARSHRTLKKRNKRKTTPAMEAGVTDHVWTWDELFHAIV